jgi:outer membrane protein assembly factor BamB
VTGELIPETTALRHGLHRRWVSQVHMDLARDRLTFATLDRDVLCVQTHNGLTQVIEAENGGSRWVAQIGRTGYPSSELTANEQYVAATNGATLYVLNLATGRPLFQKKLESTPFAAPVLDATRVYVPLFNGMIATYQLDNSAAEPGRFRSIGNIVAKPILTPKSLAWGTMRGFAYVCDPGRTNMRFQLETTGEIVSSLAYRDGVIYVTSRDGYAYALAEATGQTLWRFSAGSPLAHEPVVVSDTVYLFPEEGGMFAVSADRGTERWRRAGIKQFLALRRADPLYPELAPALYVADTSGRTLTLDPESGALVDRLGTEALTLRMTNTLNDRIYLSTPTGMIQCLHHPEVEEPLWHSSPADAAKPKRAASPAVEGEAPADEATPADEGAAEPDPFDPFDEPAE